MNASPTSQEAERLHILRMVEEGKISASEAATLLSALSQGVRPEPPASPPAIPFSDMPTGEPLEVPEVPLADRPVGAGPRWLRVRVTDIPTGRTKVTVNLPIGLVNWGLKVGARYAPEVRDFNFDELSQMLQAGAEGKLVDVMDEDDGEHVEIFVD
jgi:hypothetical protein